MNVQQNVKNYNEYQTSPMFSFFRGCVFEVDAIVCRLHYIDPENAGFLFLELQVYDVSK